MTPDRKGSPRVDTPADAGGAVDEDRSATRRLAREVGRSVVGAALARAQLHGLGGDGALDPEVVTPATRAEVLVEALPYIRRFAGSVIVVKYGGSVVTDGGADRSPVAGQRSGASLTTFVEDIALMRAVGIKPVVVHGGGPQIGEMMVKLGKEPVFKDGLRVTDAETLDIARMVLVGKVNPEIVAALNVYGPIAVGLSGTDAGLITAAPKGEDLGFVADVQGVDPTILTRLLAQDLVPVIATIGASTLGQAYNINADMVAGEIAEALGAEKLIYLTDVPGLLADVSDPDSLVTTMDCAALAAMLADGSLRGGMIPKAASCLKAVRSGVAAAHVLDGRVAHALLVEIFSDEGTGTMVTR